MSGYACIDGRLRHRYLPGGARINGPKVRRCQVCGDRQFKHKTRVGNYVWRDGSDGYFR